MVKRFGRQKCVPTVSIFPGADWAGDKATRKSISRGCIMVGKRLVKGRPKTPSLAALSSGKSDLHATLKVASEGFGLLSFAKGIGLTLAGEVWGDASATLGIINRKGLGKTRRIDTGILWVQQVAAEKRLKFGKDVYSKYLDWETTHRHCDQFSA